MITIMGATGQVGAKIAGILIRQGEAVRLVARSREALGHVARQHAEVMAGDALDTEFLASAFAGAQAVFTLIPPKPRAEDFLAYGNALGESIAGALLHAKVRHVVNLSSIGAHLATGTGPIVALHRQEERLNRLEGCQVLHLRAACFMENLLPSLEFIRSRGVNAGAIRGDLSLPMIATRDLAAVAAEQLVQRAFRGHVVRYLLGARDVSFTEATTIFGRAIGRPDLRYVMLPYLDVEKDLMAAGFSPDMSRLYAEMSQAFNDGRITRLLQRQPENQTPTTFEEFCHDVLVPAYAHHQAAA